MDLHNSTSSTNSHTSLPRRQPSHTQSLFSNFPHSESFRRLPPVLQNYITTSSVPPPQTFEDSPDLSPTFDDDSFDPFHLPSFAEVTGFRDSNGSPFTLGPSQQSANTSDFVDLSSDSDSQSMAPRRAPKRQASEASSSAPYNKRIKRDTPPKLQRNADKSIEEVDLVEEDTALADTLKKQRQEQVALQEDSQKPTKLSNLSCIICMDTPTNLTATVCGESYTSL